GRLQPRVASRSCADRSERSCISGWKCVRLPSGGPSFVAVRANADEQARERGEAIYASASRRILATLIGLLGVFDRAADASNYAFRAARDRWSKEGVPANPRAWLISTGRYKGIDTVRRRVRFDSSQTAISEQLYGEASVTASLDNDSVEDDR